MATSLFSSIFGCLLVKEDQIHDEYFEWRDSAGRTVVQMAFENDEPEVKLYFSNEANSRDCFAIMGFCASRAISVMTVPELWLEWPQPATNMKR
jgi:hypothetical protein